MRLKTLIILLASIAACNLSAQNIFRTTCNGDLARLDSMLSEATIEIKDERGRSLLHWAVACKQKEVFDHLIGKGIKVDEADKQARTPMHVAVQFNNEAYFNDLVELQPDNNWQSNHGATLLELAVLNANKSLVAKLIDNGVDIDIKNTRGSTALEISERLGTEELSELLLSKGADSSLVRVFEMEGAYMGEAAPGLKPKMFAPNFISTEEQEFGSIFNRNGTAFYFGVDVGRRNEIRYSEMQSGRWSKPVTIISHERYSYNDPFLSNDENKLYFISKRALDGKGDSKDVDIWYVEKNSDGWSAPINAGPEINTGGDEYYISFTNEGTMYFASDGHPRKDTTRKDHDIYFAKMIDNEFQKPVLLDSTINTAGYEADVFVATDESYLIFCSVRDEGFGRGDLYLSFKNTDGSWANAVNMGAVINTPEYEYCPFVTKDGKYLFYTSNQDIYWISTDIIEEIREKYSTNRD